MTVVRRKKAAEPTLRPEAEWVTTVARQRRPARGWVGNLRSEVEAEFRRHGARVYREEESQ